MAEARTKQWRLTFKEEGLPRENSGMRQYDLIIGGICIEASSKEGNARKAIQR